MRKRKESLNFYSLLIRQMTVIRDAVAALCDYCEEPSQEKGDFVKIKEKEADAVRRELVEDINRTFITPIDREDLFRLSSSVDDLADYAWTTVKELRIYDIAPDEHLLRMARTLLDMADGLLVCMANLEKNPAKVSEEATRVKKLENTLNVQSPPVHRGALPLRRLQAYPEVPGDLQSYEPRLRQGRLQRRHPAGYHRQILNRPSPSYPRPGRRKSTAPAVLFPLPEGPFRRRRIVPAPRAKNGRGPFRVPPAPYSLPLPGDALSLDRRFRGADLPFSGPAGRSRAGPAPGAGSGGYSPGCRSRSCPAASPPPGRPCPFWAAGWWSDRSGAGPQRGCRQSR